jgi:hypothetical protein
MSRHAEQHVYEHDVQVADIRDEDSSQASEREVTTVVLSLERFHDCLDSRRADAIQHAASLYEVEHVPAIAVLNAGDQTVCCKPYELNVCMTSTHHLVGVIGGRS